MMTKSEIIKAVITGIEKRFPGSVVVWTREGYPEHKAGLSKDQVFEAYGIPEVDYVAFEDFVRDLKRIVARPNGFSIMVHDLTMEETYKYRLLRYQEELTRRSLSQCIPIGSFIFQQEGDVDKPKPQWKPQKGRILASPTLNSLTIAA